MNRRKRRAFALLCAFVGILWTSGSGPVWAEPAEPSPFREHRITRIDGPALVGTVREITAEWKVRVLRSVVDVDVLDAMDVLEIARTDLVGTTQPGGIQVLFPNGDRLAVKSVEADAETIRVTHPYLGSFTIPIKHTAGLLFASRAPDGALKDAARWLGSNRRRADGVLLVNGDTVTGSLQELDVASCLIEGELGASRIDRDNIQAIAFNPEARVFAVPADLYAHLRLRDGSELSVRGLRLASTGAHLETLFGRRLRVLFLNVLACTFRNGRLLYLSDLEPADYMHTPYLSLRWPLGRDRSLDGEALQLGGRTVAKGLMQHSRSRVAYELGGKFRRFRSTIGIADAVRPRGSVVFRVRVDGAKRFESPVHRGTTKPQSVEVPLEGAARLELEVDFADHGDVCDRAVWADARLIR